MSKTLVIVESPAKAKKIKSYLGPGYEVKASFGHLRDLDPKRTSVDTSTMTPNYIIQESKEKFVKELTRAYSRCGDVILASDEDREGEAIAWHLCHILNIDPLTTPRIVFHEITKSAINKAVDNPTRIDMDMVNSQQCRRVLDRLFGYEISPVVQGHVEGATSAGRVQSVCLRLIVDRERKIAKHASEGSFKVVAQFADNIGADLKENLKDYDMARQFLEDCQEAEFNVFDTNRTKTTKKPGPPHITSTLQQEGASKCKVSAKQVMSAAQKLYENGLITYHRTDSVVLSKEFMDKAEKMIKSEYGEKYSKRTRYMTKSKDAQEAHEAIRPTDLAVKQTNLGKIENMIYQIIWKKAVASQMSHAKFDNCSVVISISDRKEQFIAKSDRLSFDGFLILDGYQHKEKNEEIWDLKKGDELTRTKITATETFTKPSPRYSESTLVKAMKVKGIGRPSTYANTISTIKDKGYVEIKSQTGEKIDSRIITLNKKKISEKTKKVTSNSEKNKLFPTEAGMNLTEFLESNFESMMDYAFTKGMEKDLDKIAKGKNEWKSVLNKYYQVFHPTVESLSQNMSRFPDKEKRLLGKHPETKEPVVAYDGRYGPVAKCGDNYANVPDWETVTLKEAVHLLSLPLKLGKCEGHDVVLCSGKFGYYVKWNGLNTTVESPYIDLDTAVKAIQEKNKNLIKKIGKNIWVKNGKYGPYVQIGKDCASVPRDMEPTELNAKQCREIIAKKLEWMKNKDN